MPIYEYECLSCGHRMEAIQKISDDELTDCPVCSKPELKKLISAAAFRLKGGGWYETDFKKSGKKNLAQNESKQKSGSGAKKDSKSDKTAGASSAPKNTAAKK